MASARVLVIFWLRRAFRVQKKCANPANHFHTRQRVIHGDEHSTAHTNTMIPGRLPRATLRRSCRAASTAVASSFESYVVPSYGRYTHLELSHGEGNRVWTTEGESFLDMGGGIAVNALGHAHPGVVKAVREQSGKLMHCSNLYLTANQAELARRLVGCFGEEGPPAGGDGSKVFFCNSGAEANEGLFKLARRHGHEQGRYEIITATNSFHGRTLAAIAATGQDKIKVMHRAARGIIDG